VVHPVQGAADGHDVEASDIFGQILGTTFDEDHVGAHPHGRCARGSEHLGLGIDTEDPAGKARKTEREQAGPGAEIDQRVLLGQRQPLRNGLEKFGRVRRPVLFVEFGRGCEASHASTLVGRAGRFYLAQITSPRLSREPQTCCPPLIWISAPLT
jgi:hypothetical protein